MWATCGQANSSWSDELAKTEEAFSSLSEQYICPYTPEKVPEKKRNFPLNYIFFPDLPMPGPVLAIVSSTHCTLTPATTIVTFQITFAHPLLSFVFPFYVLPGVIDCRGLLFCMSMLQINITAFSWLLLGRVSFCISPFSSPRLQYCTWPLSWFPLNWSWCSWFWCFVLLLLYQSSGHRLHSSFCHSFYLLFAQSVEGLQINNDKSSQIPEKIWEACLS